MSDATDLAREIRPYLPMLLGDEASVTDGRLADLLQDANSGTNVDDQILQVINSHEATRVWANRFLGESSAGERRGVGSRSRYEALPGDAEPIKAPKYQCPRGDYVWYRPFVGISIPRCPTHNLRLVPVD